MDAPAAAIWPWMFSMEVRPRIRYAAWFFTVWSETLMPFSYAERCDLLGRRAGLPAQCGRLVEADVLAQEVLTCCSFHSA
jgi:hypothetical protein